MAQFKANSNRAPKTGKPDDPPAQAWPLVVRVWAYTAIVLLVVLAAGVYGLRRNGIFACRANGYDNDRYLAYCQAVNYADYDHGAFWFDLEPEATAAAGTSDVLFLGNSRMQFGLSTTATDELFADVSARYYLLGFSFNGNVVFEQPLLEKLKARPRLYVLNLDEFFGSFESPPARTVMRDRDALGRHQQKRRWQTIHKLVCGNTPLVCGNARAFYRSRRTGSWMWEGGGETQSPVSYDHSIDQTVVRDSRERGTAFLSGLSIEPQCVIATIVPTVQTRIGTAQAVAEALALTFAAPALTDLSTFDESHLDANSAQRWSAAFFQAVGPRIRECLASPGGSLVAPSVPPGSVQ
jgi:hypothetical protein